MSQWEVQAEQAIKYFKASGAEVTDAETDKIRRHWFLQSLLDRYRLYKDVNGQRVQIGWKKDSPVQLEILGANNYCDGSFFFPFPTLKNFSARSIREDLLPWWLRLRLALKFPGSN